MRKLLGFGIFMPIMFDTGIKTEGGATESKEQVESKVRALAKSEAEKLFAEKAADIFNSEDSKKTIKELAEKALEGLKIKEADGKETALTTLLDEMQKQHDTLSAAFKSMKEVGQPEVFDFSKEFGKSISEKSNDLKAFANTKGKLDLSIEMKAVGDMSLSNFGAGAYANVTTDYRQSVYQSPFGPLWLRNILPTVTTDKGSIQYIQENGGEGAAAVWDGTPVNGVVPDKPQVDYDFILKTENVDWIAGTTTIPRGMLDDAAFLRTYIPNQLVYGRRGLFVAENAYIMSVLDANDTAYDGTKTIPLERVYDAAFCQLRDNYFAPTHILMNHRDVVNYIALNKASGSGEYDLPIGTVAVINGQMTIGGVPVVGVPNIASGSFRVIDNRVIQFISRMSAEVRISEEHDKNFVKNLVTFRAEERIATLVLDTAGVITGTLVAAG